MAIRKSLIVRFSHQRRLPAWREARRKRHVETVKFSDRKRFDQQPEFWSPLPSSGMGCATAAREQEFGGVSVSEEAPGERQDQEGCGFHMVHYYPKEVMGEAEVLAPYGAF